MHFFTNLLKTQKVAILELSPMKNFKIKFCLRYKIFTYLDSDKKNEFLISF
jgi:hypothetical protein